MILKGDTFSPFFVSIYTRLCFFYIKKGFINVFALFVSSLTLLEMELLSGVSVVSSWLLGGVLSVIYA